jgi:hypothetical protein
MCAITGIVTPLGLGDELTTLAARDGTFEYVKDDSAYRLGTTTRGQYPVSRVCDGEHQERTGKAQAVAAVCPYSNTEMLYVDREFGEGFDTEMPNGYNTSIPDEARAIFSSGTGNSTVSNFFDIEWRQLSRRISSTHNNTVLTAGMYRQLNSVIMENRYKLVEGLIIDAKVGGIGFRNHTAPVGLSRGATWEEDILFIEPSTACVNTNLTLDFEITMQGGVTGGNTAYLMLTDRGGFSQMNTTLATLEPGDGQTNPDLQQRAYKAAWVNNAFTMLYLNVTNERDKPEPGMEPFSYMNSTVGKEFPMPMPDDDMDRLEGLRLSMVYGNYLRLNMKTAGVTPVANYSSPSNITEADFDTIAYVCGGTAPTDRANISNIYVACGLLRGAPHRTDGGNPLLFESGSKWSSPLHSCASALRATSRRCTSPPTAPPTPPAQGWPASR